MIKSPQKARPSPVQLFSSQFCQMLKDVDYNSALGMFEKAASFLTEMWRPTGPDEATQYYAVASEKSRLTNLAHKWIGNLPPKTDIEHITRFISSFSGLFITEPDNLEELDPFTQKAIIDMNKLFSGILQRLDPAFIINKAREEWMKKHANSYSAEVPEPQIYCTPLQWKDLYEQWGVFIHYSPKGHQFLYNDVRYDKFILVLSRCCLTAIKWTEEEDSEEQLSEVYKRLEMEKTGVLQEGYCHSTKYSRSEVRILPDVIVDGQSPLARGPQHSLTRAKFRTLEYIKCLPRPEAELVRGPLCPEPEDLVYEEMTCQLPSHRNAAPSLARRAHTVCRPPQARPLPRWLRRDPLKWAPAADPPRPCTPAPHHPNRRAFEVNPHIPFRPLSLEPCPVYGSGMHRGVSRRRKMVDANTSNTHTAFVKSVFATATAAGTSIKERIRLPPLYADHMKLRPVSLVKAEEKDLS